MLTIPELSVCVRHAAEGRARAAARVVVGRMADMPEETTVERIVLGIIRFAAVRPEELEWFETQSNEALRVRLTDGSSVWLAAADFPQRLPGPVFSLRGLQALGAALLSELT